AIQLLQHFATRHGGPPGTEYLHDFLTLAGFSPYLGGLLVQNPDFLEVLPSGGPARGPRTIEDLDEDLARFQSLRAGDDDSIVLRKFKQREYLRIALADALGTADLPAITRALSLLADVLLQKAVHMARAPLEAQHGRPTSRDDQGQLEQVDFTIVALGKLGGEELNYSSDIDLIYLYGRDGETAGLGERGEGGIRNREFFTRLAAEVTRLIAGGGPEGQVFRVDLDLRPGGRDGDLVMTVNAATAYYRNWAETWERQALCKARPAAGDLPLGRRFVAEVEELIYRCDPDPYMTLEISAMKDRIDARLSSQGRTRTDIKLGWGGIREIEFAVQALQLQHGGRDPWLREGNTLLALHRLAEKGFLGYAECAALGEAYVFLRDLEHRLQLGRNRQTSNLPARSKDLERLARRMRSLQRTPGGPAEALMEALDRHRGVVRAFYDTVFSSAAQPRIGEGIEEAWLERLDEGALRDRVRRAGIEDAEVVLRPVQLIGRRLHEAAGTSERRSVFRKAGSTLLQMAAATSNPRRALGNLERLIASLTSHPENLERFLAHREILGPIIQVLGRSNMLAGLLIRQPLILSRLEDRLRVVRTTTADDYRHELVEPTAKPGRSRAARLAALQRRQQEELATIALRDINQQSTLRQALKSLSNLADAVLEAVLNLEREGLAPRMSASPAGPLLTVLGLGRLGYRELDFGSDLDLVFVLDGGPASVAVRWCEAIVRTLGTLSRDGQLYRVDLRLRPSGREGELVPTLDGLVEYFRNDAEVWEMQSFLKARPVAGDLDLGRQAVEAVERVILERARTMDAREIGESIDAMRRRIQDESAQPGGVKLGEGGLLDVHFAIDVLRLRHATPNPADKDTLRLLTHLHSLGHLPESQMGHLYEGYLFLRALEHGMRLLYDRPLGHLPEEPEALAELAMVIDPARPSGQFLRVGFERHTARVRETYERILADV
ncbi:MAG: bifunctional [glutamate--ammonia ligase]-adenylyl-L-tyrosine phosphorylase/[glutamate--ammonia-ligase] adenylyltransferase, partial [Acidobacteria bacterium]|nr:bifunctional [glutamate--ammonia ligase]-adenylyl-L-tyrosine phosphorylase/[glutamate--ammonia-ligase] adenylyltransferase [Acidobacteriota bacterium]